MSAAAIAAPTSNSTRNSMTSSFAGHWRGAAAPLGRAAPSNSSRLCLDRRARHQRHDSCDFDLIHVLSFLAICIALIPLSNGPGSPPVPPVAPVEALVAAPVRGFRRPEQDDHA